MKTLLVVVGFLFCHPAFAQATWGDVAQAGVGLVAITAFKAAIGTTVAAGEAVEDGLACGMRAGINSKLGGNDPLQRNADFTACQWGRQAERQQQYWQAQAQRQQIRSLAGQVVLIREAAALQQQQTAVVSAAPAAVPPDRCGPQGPDGTMSCWDQYGRPYTWSPNWGK